LTVDAFSVGHHERDLCTADMVVSWKAHSFLRILDDAVTAHFRSRKTIMKLATHHVFGVVADDLLGKLAGASLFLEVGGERLNAYALPAVLLKGVAVADFLAVSGSAAQFEKLPLAHPAMSPAARRVCSSKLVHTEVEIVAPPWQRV